MVNLKVSFILRSLNIQAEGGEERLSQKKKRPKGSYVVLKPGKPLGERDTGGVIKWMTSAQSVAFHPESYQNLLSAHKRQSGFIAT